MMARRKRDGRVSGAPCDTRQPPPRVFPTENTLRALCRGIEQTDLDQVNGLKNGFNGAELLTASAVNATGIRIGFSNRPGPIFVNHYRVYEVWTSNDPPQAAKKVLPRPGRRQRPHGRAPAPFGHRFDLGRSKIPG